MSCNTKTSLAAVIDAVNAQLNNNYVDRDDPRIDQGVFTEPTIRGGLMLDEAAKLDFCGYVTECGQREPFGKQWVDRPLYPDNTLVSYDDGGEIKSRWQDTDDVVAGTEIGDSYTAYEETRNLGLQGYTIIDSFELGATITQPNQALRHAADGKLYRWAGELPKVVPANSTPETSGGIANDAWLEVSDVTLRQDLANPDMGAVMVARGVVAVDSVADLLVLSEGQRKEGLRYLVKEYHAGTGVGGGEFYWDASSTEDKNGGTVFGDEVLGRFKRILPTQNVIDITMFGAVDDKTIDSTDAIIAALGVSGAYRVVFPPTDTRHEDDILPARGFMASEPIQVPLDKELHMESPLIYSGSVYPALTIGVAPASKSTKPHFKDFRLWVVRSEFSTWPSESMTGEVGLKLNCSDFCNFHIYQVLGFQTGVHIQADTSSFAYNNILWGEIRQAQYGTYWEVVGSGYINECYHESGRFSSAPAPSSGSAKNRYGVVTSSEGHPFNNHLWHIPTFELNYGDNEESVPLVLDNCTEWRVTQARMEGSKKWNARLTGNTSRVHIDGDRGALDPGIITAYQSRIPKLDDQSTGSRENSLTIGWQKTFIDGANRVESLPLECYPSGTAGSVRGMFFVSDSEVFGSRGTVRTFNSLRPLEVPGVGYTANSTGIAFRLYVGGEPFYIKKKSNTAGQVRIRCYGESMEELYDADTLLARSVIFGNAGSDADSNFGGSYNPGPGYDGMLPISVDPSVHYVDVIFIGLDYELYGVDAHLISPNGRYVPVNNQVAATSKPGWTENLEDGLTVSNLSYSGTGAHTWRLLEGVWVDIE